MRLLDLLLVTLAVFPWLSAGVHIGDFELRDLGVPLLVLGLLALWWRGGRPRPSRRTMLIAAAALAVAFGLSYLWGLRNPGFGLISVTWSATHHPAGLLLLIAFGMAVRHWRHEPWDASLVLRPFLRLAQAWVRAIERRAAVPLWTAAALAGALYAWVALLRHGDFQPLAYDLGVFVSAIWNLTHGYGYVSATRGGMNLFAEHQSPLFWALAPPFWIAPYPETLLLAQAFGLAAGGPALYYWSRAQIGRGHWAPAMLPWLYWAYLPLRNANAFDFHPEVFMLPLFLWAFAAFGAGRRGLGLLALACALGAKESAPVVGAGIGIAWALVGPRRWPGVALFAASVAVFVFDVKVVPRLFGADYAWMHLYQRFGGGVIDVLLAPFTQPTHFFSEILTWERLVFLFWTLAPLGFLPLFHWRAALAVVPPYLALFLTPGEQRVQLFFHYGIEPGSALFWALPFGVAAFARRFGWERAAIWMLVWGVAAHGTSELARARSFNATPHAPWLAEALRCIDPHAPLAASSALLPRLSTRHWASHLFELEQKPSGEKVRCVVVDSAVGNWPLDRIDMRAIVARWLPGQGYREVYRCREFRVFELGEAGCLRCRPQCD